MGASKRSKEPPKYSKKPASCTATIRVLRGDWAASGGTLEALVRHVAAIDGWLRSRGRHRLREACDAATAGHLEGQHYYWAMNDSY